MHFGNYLKKITKPLVTIVIPVYNEENCIKDCILSLFNQDFKPIEIIVVDDGSKDNSIKTCEAFQVRILRQSHKGMAAARNLGALNSKGNILVMLDSDMIFQLDYVSKLAKPIIRGESIATCHWNEMVSNWDNPWARCQTWFAGLPDRRRQPFKSQGYSGQYRAVRKDFFIEHGGLDERAGYKADISIYKRTGVYAEIVQDATCYHRNIENPRELLMEALWRGRNVPYLSKNKLKRCLGILLTPDNPLMHIYKGIYLSIKKNEFFMFPYSVIYTAGFISGMFHSLYSGYYQK